MRSTSAPETPQARFVWGAALVVLLAVVYLPALQGGFVSDDGTYVTGNEALRSSQGLADIWLRLGTVEQYYPLVHSSFWVEYHLWGDHPLGYHAVNVLLHAVAVLLVWRLLEQLAVPGAWLGAALFAVHPVEVESVAWISERKNLLSCCLALGSLFAYFRFWPAELDQPAQPRRWGWYALALGLFLAALLSKTVTASVPAVVLVIRWWKCGRLTRRDVMPLLPMFAVGLVLAWLTVWMEQHYVGARGASFEFTPVERVLIAGRAVWFYAAKLAWPYPLIFYYPRWTIDAHGWWQYVYPLAALAVLGLLWMSRERIGRGPLAAALIFVGVLAPALGFFNVYPFRLSLVADHYQYHASIALLALAAAVGCELSQRLRWPASRLLPVAAVVLVAVLGWRTFLRTRVYQDEFVLSTDTVLLNPEAFAAHNNLGTLAMQTRQYEQAIDHFQAAIAANGRLVRLRNNLASALHAAGRADEAFAQLDHALSLPAEPADRHGTHLLFELLLLEQQKYDQVLEHCRAALAIAPTDAYSLYNCALALRGKGDLEGAAEKLRQAQQLQPDSAMLERELREVEAARRAMPGAADDSSSPR